MKTIIAVLIIGALAIGGYSAIKKNKTNTTAVYTAQETAPTQTTEKPVGKKIAFSEFIKQSGSYQCTVHQNLSDFDTGGTVYISDGKLRGDFSTIAEGRTVTSSVLARDGFVYSWSSMMPNKGVKMAMTMAELSNPAASTSGTYVWNASQIGDYSCTPWIAQEPTFGLPSGTTFTTVKY
jgi:hypothetical protein